LSAGNGVDLLSIDGVSFVQILGGTGANTLSAVSSGTTNGTIDGNTVTLVAGQEVLQASNFNTYNDYSALDQILNFGGLKANSTSYTQQLASGSSFTLTSTGGDLEPNTSISSAVAASTTSTEFTLTAADGGLFALYGISLNTNGGSSTQLTFTGTTADGKSVTQTLPVSQSSGFENFVFPASFTALTKVTWTPGSTLATNVVVSELYPHVTPGPNPGSVPTVSGPSDETIAVVASSQGGSISLNGTPITGTFNGTPWYTVVDSAHKLVDFYFQGDLYLPDKTTMTITGDYGAVFEVGGNVILGQNVTIDASASGQSAGPGGGAGSSGGGGGTTTNSRGGSGGGGSGGSGGGGGDVTYTLPNYYLHPGSSGTTGGFGDSGASGGAGNNGQTGVGGSAGINGGAGGQRGQGGGGGGGGAGEFGGFGGRGGNAGGGSTGNGGMGV
jgi:hypothetical protein